MGDRSTPDNNGAGFTNPAALVLENTRLSAENKALREALAEGEAAHQTRLLELGNQLEKTTAYAKHLEAGTENMQRLINEASRRSDELLAERLHWQSRFTSKQDVTDMHDSLVSRMSIMSADLADLRGLLVPATSQGDATTQALRLRYLDVLEAVLTGRVYEDPSISPWVPKAYNAERRMMGRDWPAQAHTMIGTARMRNIRMLVQTVLKDDIEGDLLEAGVWRGGACIYMRGILAAYNVIDRKVWVADSFEGLPPPDMTYPQDQGDTHYQVKELAVPLEEVRKNFSRYNLLDEQVQFLKGWFKDTLPQLPTEKLALVRLDGDMYSSTIETLEATYDKLAVGGFLIVDDYTLPGAHAAVHDFRREHNVSEPIDTIDGAATYWRKRS